MIVEKRFYIKVYAKCLNNKEGLNKDKTYLVKNIFMGQSSTDILLENLEDKPYNSVNFEFYVDNKKIDIYRSPLFNSYTKYDPKNMIKFIEE